MKKLFVVMNLLLFLSAFVRAQENLLYNLAISNSAANQPCISLDENSVVFNTESEITPNSVVYRKLSAEFDEGIEFDVTEYLPMTVLNGAFTIGVKTQSGKYFAFKFLLDKIQIISEGAVVPALQPFSSDSHYKLQRIDNTLSFYAGTILLFQKTLDTDLGDLSLDVSITDGSVFQAKVKNLKILKGIIALPLTNGYENQVYVSLKKQLDGSLLNLTGDLIRFKFDEDYNALVDGANYAIYDWRRGAPKQAGSLSIVNRTNWCEVLCNSTLISNNIYTLEITANKGEKYFLRFRLGSLRSY